MRRGRSVFAWLAAFCLFLIFLPISALADSHYTLLVHFIDVGQGGAALIQLRGKNILYDCGDTGKGKDVLEYLQDQEVKEIDLTLIRK